MADLPPARVCLSRPFLHTGMDYAGPFTIAAVPGRKPKLMKAYFCVFVCMAVKAVHLELVGDLSTPSLLAALKKFTARRGLPHSLYSDGGKNFIGANSELDRVMSLLQSKDFTETIGNFCTGQGIESHYNPPLSPHHGGLLEAAVKSVKIHLRPIIDDRHLSIEEISTVLCQIESILNFRPLTPVSSDPSDVSALTPAHFLVGGPLHSIQEEDFISRKFSSLKRWEVRQRISQHFWKRFHQEYLQILKSRPKWLVNQPNVEPGVLVLVKESDAVFSSHKWNLARVTQVFPGLDGKVRVVETKTSNGSLFRRPIVKISPIPIEPTTNPTQDIKDPSVPPIDPTK